MTRVPDWKLERYALGELPPEELEAVRQQLEREEGGLERLARLESSNREILLSLPPRAMGAEIRRKAGSRGRRARTIALVALPLAVAVGAGLLFALPDTPVEQQASTAMEHDILVKGPPILVHRQVGDGDEPLVDEDRAAAGDVLQLSYEAQGWPHGIILSLDGAGAVTLHYPLDGDTHLDQDGRVDLPEGYRLDDAPDFERFVMVRGRAALDVDPILAAGRELAAHPDRAAEDPLPVSEELDQRSLVLWKTP